MIYLVQLFLPFSNLPPKQKLCKTKRHVFSIFKTFMSNVFPLCIMKGDLDAVLSNYHYHSVAVRDLELPYVAEETRLFIHTVTAEALTLERCEPSYCAKG